MFSATLAEVQQRDLAKNVTSFLSLYKHISDSYIIEFFSENLWETLPVGWQKALGELSAPQIADLLLDNAIKDRKYPSVWPLSLLAFRASAHSLAFPRIPPGQQAQEPSTLKPEEFQGNQSQSSLLGHIFRKHVKPKKQHEIRSLGMLVKQLCDQTDCDRVVDVGSGQGHLTRFLSFGLGLSVTGIEADPNLVSMASKFDGQLLNTLEKESQRRTVTPQLSRSAPGPSPRHVIGWVNPRATWDVFIQQLGKGETESESHASSVGPGKKRPWISMSGSDQEHTCGSQLLCTAESDCTNCSEGGQTMLLHQRTDVDYCTDSISKFEKGAGMDESPSGPLAHTCSDRTSSTDPNLCPCKTGHRSSNFVLTGLHACGDLSATLLRHFVSCPHVQGITSVACCYMKITTKENPTPPGIISPPLPIHSEGNPHSEFGYPMSEWVWGLPGHQLSYKAREGACHAMEDYLQRLREENGLLKTHCYRATLETIIRAERPDLRRAGIQTIKKAHSLPFSEYARLGLPRVGLPADLPLDHANVGAMLRQQGRVVLYFSLALLLAPVVETLVLLDRMLFLQEKGLPSQLVPLFDPAFSPRNLVLVATKTRQDGGMKSTL